MKNSKILIIISCIVLVILFMLVSPILLYYFNQYKNSLKISDCYNADTNNYSINEDFFSPYQFKKWGTCYVDMYELMLPNILIHDVTIEGKPPKINMLSSTIFFAQQMMDISDIVLDYGVGTRETVSTGTYQFGNDVAKTYNKPSYIFDCGLREEEISKKLDSPLCTFKSECIGTDEFITKGQISSGKFHTLKQKLEELNALDKKVYVKFGVPELFIYMPEVLENSDNITGMTLTLDLWSPMYIIETIKMLKEINKKFVLVSKYSIVGHHCYIKYAEQKCPHNVLLTYVNKKYIDSDTIGFNQKGFLRFDSDMQKRSDITKDMCRWDNISPVLVIAENLKSKVKNLLNKQ